MAVIRCGESEGVLRQALAASARSLGDDGADQGCGRVEPVILWRPQLTAHEHMRAAKPHAARYRLARRKMNFVGLGGDDSIDVALRDSSTGHDDDAVPCALDKFNNERQPLESARLLA